ncbi:MAG: hypothetical protein ACRDQ4_16095 [Pseudonocardiaceae bacterium]
MGDKNKDGDKDKGSGGGKHRDRDEEEISQDGQQKGRPLPPPDDGHEKH